MSSQLLAAANCSHLQPHLLRAAICSNLQQLAHSSHLSSHLQPLAAICRENSQTAPVLPLENVENSPVPSTGGRAARHGPSWQARRKERKEEKAKLETKALRWSPRWSEGAPEAFQLFHGPPCLLKSNMRIRPASSYRYRNLTLYLFKDCLQAGCLGYFSRFGNLPWVESTCIGSIPASIFLRP